ncbi:MAG: methylenetetrahydrofolate reductase [Candidatus Acetothermia bacterium]
MIKVSRLKAKLQQEKFVVTCEAGPPKGAEVEDELREIDEIAHLVDAFNVTDLQSSVMRLGSLAYSHLIEDRGHEAIYQLTCRDRNRLALQSDLISAWTLGLENVLALTGDHTTLGDHPQAKPVFDLDSPQLLRVIGSLNSGMDMQGNELQGGTDFYPGATANPAADPLEPQIVKMNMKEDNGARFFQTQAVYDSEAFRQFVEAAQAAGVEAPILAGILPLKSAGMARFMNANIAGVKVPEALIEELEEADNTLQKSLKIASCTIREVKDFCQGVHLMPMGWESHVPEIIDLAEL